MPRGPDLAETLLRPLVRSARNLLGRYRARHPERLRFRGAFATHQEALANIGAGKLKGYDNDAVTDVSKVRMQEVPLWDYPVLYWLKRLSPEIRCLVDAGGHVGVKYRAFAPYLDLGQFDWVVYDLPALVRAGQAQKRVGDRTLSFVDRIEDAPAADVLLASGLMPYLDTGLAELVGRLRARPRCILLNKVVTRDGPTVVTLENFGMAEVPYHIRNVDEVPDALAALGYEIVDSWTIDSLSHRIETNPELGHTTYRGYAAFRRGDTLSVRLGSGNASAGA